MKDNSDKIGPLLEKLDVLLKRQEDFSKEINGLRLEINLLKANEIETETPIEEIKLVKPVLEGIETQNEKVIIDPNQSQHQVISEPAKQSVSPINRPPQGKSNLEKFIGENLINKIGIAITVIGVAIGAKYSIENNLISPLTRIILGYLFGLSLLGVGFKLKSKYEEYSAVLVSGAMAIMYFITYAAYGFYDLFPQVLAFAIMVIFTVFTVVAAINFNKQVIAHIGLVGAYAVPFLLSEGSGKVTILFSYMAIINIGILAIAFKKYWKSLYYSSFGLTWLIYFLWYITKYQTSEHLVLAFSFLTIFFVIFYLTFLAYKVVQKEKFDFDDLVLLIVNSFIFYAIGYHLLSNHKTGVEFLGLFTLFNAVIHFVVSSVIYRQKLADRNLFYLISGLVLVFITMAVPVQLDGNWVTLLWAGEAALVFWIGRTKNVSFYEKLSYPLMILAFVSLNHDWITVYDGYNTSMPETRINLLLNINFLSSLLFLSAFGFINMLSHSKKHSSSHGSNFSFLKEITLIHSAILLFTLYYAFYLEISTYWNQLYADSSVSITNENNQYPENFKNSDLLRYKAIWLINYTLLFASTLSIFNIRKFKNPLLGNVTLALIAFSMFVFLTQGLYSISELRESYIDKELSQYYNSGIFNILIRYISLSIVAFTLVICYKNIRQSFIQTNFNVAFDFLLHISILWITSSEFINWMDIADSTQSYKLGLSILWGIYSLMLIVIGIMKKKKHLRVGAIIIFGITLLKLFFYDISHLNTISKTIVFVSLGLLLLIISFLYNKHKHNLYDEN